MKRDMFNQFLLFLLVILFYPCLLDSHSLHLNSTTITFSSCLPHQSSILLQFRTEFTFQRREYYDGYPKMKNWKSGSDCCSSWDGVSCDMATGYVISLDLSDSWLHGSLRSNSSLFSLLHLQKLNLAFNNFNYCPIPSEFGQLSRLTHLNLSNSMFYGHIPIFEISRLTNLISLDLSFNGYMKEGEFGRLTQNMTNLRQLYLDSVQIDSPVPTHFANLSSLTHLSFQGCNLLGEFPNDLFNLPNLQFIQLSVNNNLSGSFPEFRSGSMLKLLNLADTKFSGKIPNSIGNVKSLNSLTLSSCSFLGIIPSSIGNLTELIYLLLGGNGFSGQIPYSLGNLTQLEHLVLESNSFSGKLPISLPRRVKSIESSHNDLTGSIPSIISNLTFLEWLDLSDNSFTEVIPGSLFKLPSLRYFSLENNQFTGYLDIQNFSNLSQLKSLILSGNNLTGHIPSSVSKFTMLSYLNLDSNDLSGKLDFGIFSEMSSLSYLDLSNNRGLFITNLSTTSNLSSQFRGIYLSSCNIREFPMFLKTQGI
ncbi:receptor-like protein 6 [Ziziphus jujuba]|uniref:Receptor-like protein 6 n=1 Tax=Ziziphus jujuba TaxID=326968 RepID=A0ABM4A2Y7_ZIZJJ|nr:receptor-like protein 6 [Ziziphus jujuba]